MDGEESLNRPMDWPAIAQLLAERIDRPLVLLDRSNKICLFNSAAEKILGWRRHDVDGGAWVDRFAAAENRDATLHWLEQAQRGVLHKYECEIVTKTGGTILALLDMTLVGRGRIQGLLLAVEASFPVNGPHPAFPGQHVDYEISLSPLTFGELRSVSASGTGLHVVAEKRRRCFEFLYSRGTPCDDCPVLRPPTDSWPRVTIRGRGAGEQVYEITKAELATSTSVRLSMKTVTAEELSAIRGVRVKALADRASLTERERAVMEYLLDGRSLDEIAALLGMSPRTAKFHQTNLLGKLGADSRSDLFRLACV